MKTVTLDSDNDDDIAVVMQTRARQGYGSDKSYKVTGDEELSMAWAWCDHVVDMVTQGQLRQYVRSGVRVPGAR